MSWGAEPPDDLQEIWRENDASPEGENIAMMLLLLREKQRSLRDLIQGQNVAEYLIALILAPLTALMAWKARPAILQLGYGIVSTELIAGSVITWLNDRRSKPFRDIKLDVREYHRRLLDFYERRIRFLKSVKFWYALPLFSGAALVLLPLAARSLPGPWGIVIIAALLLIAWIGVWHMNDVRRVGELHRRREEVLRLMEQMDRG